MQDVWVLLCRKALRENVESNGSRSDGSIAPSAHIPIRAPVSGKLPFLSMPSNVGYEDEGT